MSFELNLKMTEQEAKHLWKFMSGQEIDLDITLSELKRRLEASLWDRLSIEEMVCAAAGAEAADG